jgi:hypothetical protein
MRKDFTPPAWFRFRSRQQEEVVNATVSKLDATDRIQEIGMEEAKAKALPMMAKVVQDLEARPDSAITGGTRPWTPEVWARVQRNERKKMKYWISYFLQLFNHA